MNKLWSFGDSWTYGVGVDTNQTFTQLIADSLNLEPLNLGIPGSANSSIYNKLIHYCINFKPGDLVLINWTSPHRDEFTDRYSFRRSDNKLNFNIKYYPEFLNNTYNKLKGFNFIMTQAFNPIFGYDYSLNTEYHGKNFIEWGKPNNTLVDIISNNWCKENTNNLFMSDFPVEKDFSMFVKDDNHPSAKGHKLIADKLLEYL
tara:strand:+ start:463 stop:1068 length:606 start_codon:yes stop_codon:yes gene_type:complete